MREKNNNFSSDQVLYSQRSLLETWNVLKLMMYYPCSENKGADQIRGYCEADPAPLFSVSFLMRRFLFCSAFTKEKKRIIGTFRPISIKKRMGNRVYSAAHVSSLTMPRNLSVILLNIHSGFQVDFRENYSDHS